MNKKELVGAMAVKTEASGAASDRGECTGGNYFRCVEKRGFADVAPVLGRSKYVIVPHGLAAIPKLVRN